MPTVRMMCPRQLIEGLKANGAEIGEGGNLRMAVLAVRRRVFHNVSQWARPKEVIDRAPRGRELSVREDLTRIIVDWSGSWQAARPGNWLGRSPATKAALGC